MLSDKVLDVVLEELNLQEGEEFEVRSFIIVIDGKLQHRINKNGLECFYNGVWNNSIHLGDLLLGKLRTFKLPFVPGPTEAYYVPDISIADLYSKITNYGTKHDKHRVDYEICFKTKEEAIAKAKWLLS